MIANVRQLFDDATIHYINAGVDAVWQFGLFSETRYGIVLTDIDNAVRTSERHRNNAGIRLLCLVKVEQFFDGKIADVISVYTQDCVFPFHRFEPGSLQSPTST